MRISGWFRGFALLLLALPAPGLAEPARLALDPRGLEDFRSYTAVDGRVVFFGLFPAGSTPAGQAQCALWEIDPVTGAAEPLAKVCAGEGDFLDPNLRVIADTGAVVFFADSSGFLWRTDGTSAGTFPLRNVEIAPPSSPPGSSVLGPDGRTLFFSGCTPAAGCEPWRSDGTRQGTRPLGDLLGGAIGSNPTHFTVAGGRVLFTVDGRIWSTGGTAADTVLLAQIPGASIQGFLSQGSLIYFLALDRPGETVQVLETATGRVRRLASFPSDPRNTTVSLRVVAGRLLFVEFDPHGEAYRIWQVNGEQARPIGPPFDFTLGGDLSAVAGGRIVFAAARGTSSRQQLWALDPGTKKPHLLQGCPGGCPEPALAPAVVFDGRLYFAVLDAGQGFELWTSDGTAQGTRRFFKNLCPGPCASEPTPLRVALGRLLFSDGAGRLWASDGTAAGTVRFAQAPFGPPSFVPLDFAEINGRIVFTGLDPVSGPQPFRSDLTPEGTEPLSTIGDGEHGRELWALPLPR
jgi:ELWxxDGT repeat protein